MHCRFPFSGLFITCRLSLLLSQLPRVIELAYELMAINIWVFLSLFSLQQVNKTVTEKEGGGYLTKYRGEHLEDCIRLKKAQQAAQAAQAAAAQNGHHHHHHPHGHMSIKEQWWGWEAGKQPGTLNKSPSTTSGSFTSSWVPWPHSAILCSSSLSLAFRLHWLPLHPPRPVLYQNHAQKKTIIARPRPICTIPTLPPSKKHCFLI